MDNNDRRAGASLVTVLVAFAVAAIPAWIVSDKILGASSSDVGLSRSAGIILALVMGLVAAGLTFFFSRRGDAPSSRRVAMVAGAVILVYVILVAVSMAGTDHSVGQG